MLTATDIENIVATVPGGARNVQDIYRLAPLQEGILFHHILARQGDPYLTRVAYRVSSQSRLSAFLEALQAVVDRHDVLRTAVLWENLPEPVQVVWRRASLTVEDVGLDPAAGAVVDQLMARYEPRRYRIDLRQAPLLRVGIAFDAANDSWAMVLLFHHLVHDNGSFALLREEVHQHLIGRFSSLPSPVPYRNFVAHCRLVKTQEGHEAFFRRMLADFNEPTAPFGWSAVGSDWTDIKEARRLVGVELSRRLRACSRASGVSAASLCHFALARVLGAVTGREDVVFGTVLAGRMQGGEGCERALGPFINTLPVRVRLADCRVRDSVRGMHALLAQILDHEHASLAVAQRCSAIAAPAQLFSALLNYRHSESRVMRSEADIAAWDGIDLLGAKEQTCYPFTMTVDDLGEDFGLAAQVPSSFDPERFCGLMYTALESVIAALERTPHLAAYEVEVLSKAERDRLLFEWNDTVRPYPADGCLHELFEAQVVASPDAVAVVHEGGQLTYAELNAQSNRLANHLSSIGVARLSRVAVCMERSPELIATELAILKCSAIYVPFDCDSPPERLRSMLDDCQVSVLVCKSNLVIPEIVLRRINLDETQFTSQSSENLATNGSATEPAYIMYTSGSTGEPKGVVVPHQAISRLVINNGFVESMTSDRIAFASSPAFDASTMEVWCALLNGGAVVIIDQETLLSSELLQSSLERHGVTILWLTSELLTQHSLALPGAFRNLRYLISGGDVLNVEAVARILTNGPPQHLLNGYGPTESTTFAATYEIQTIDGLRRIPIGRPISNTRIYILDERLNLVPTNAVGEIYIGGPGVSLGYWNRPSLNDERFLNNPFVKGDRLYKTGDLARVLADGNIDFLGRDDFQVKIRGFRIELGEIEARLAQHPLVRNAVVVSRHDVAGLRQLVGYYTTVDVQSDLGADNLRTYLQEYLPEYMIPVAYIALDALPVTATGKLDRNALPLPDITSYVMRDHEPPTGEIENLIASIWTDLLMLTKIGRHDNFFDLGGHSLLAIRVVSRLRLTLDVAISVNDIFNNPVLKDLGKLLKKARTSKLSAFCVADRDKPLSLSFAQQRLWVLAQIEGAADAYHISIGLRLSGDLDRQALRKSLNRILARHESLRSTFALVDGEPAQRVASANSAFVLFEHDLSEKRDTTMEGQRFAAEEAIAPFDLKDGPLLRGRLLKLGVNEHTLLITMHHIVSDGWSIGLFIRELSALYLAYVGGQADPLPALPLQYADYAASQRRWLTNDALEEQGTYWQSALAGAPPIIELPIDRPRPAHQDFAGARLDFTLDVRLTAQLEALSQLHGTTLFMTTLAAWSTLLMRLSGQDNVVIGVPFANRTRAEVEELIGCFVNTLALRLDFSDRPTVSEMLLQVKSQTLAAQENQDIPFEQVVEILNPPRSLSHTPLFQVLFSWQNMEQGELELSGLKVSRVDQPATFAKFDLTLTLSKFGGQIVGSIEYATALFNRSTVEHHISYLRNVLSAMVADDQQLLATLPFLSDSERERMVVNWNATDAPYPAERCIHELFEEQASKSPESIAIVYEGSHLTYAELNARANRLAHYLLDSGVRPDARVALCIERSFELAVGLLAILKAGGAYVPLDPSYPIERLRLMLKDSASVAVLTHGAISEAMYGMLRASGVVVVDLLVDAAAWDNAPSGNLESYGLTPRHLAYVIYTSGTTGTPKGVMNEHRAVVNRLWWMQSLFKLGAQDRVLQKTPLGFDVSVWEFFWPLLSGARLLITRTDGHRDPAYLREFIRDQGITTLHFVPSMLDTFCEFVGSSNFPSVKRVICSGEALKGRVAVLVPSVFPNAELWNLYGPTEAAVDVTAWRWTKDELSENVPIGYAIANARVYILDLGGEPVPIRVVGELHIGGVPVARGYLNRPDLTAERFVPSPFVDGDRLYKTGDLARYLPNGAIEFVGRNDFQVKLRGFRIELGEIESRLIQHPLVAQAVVLARKDAPHREELVAYYTIADAAQADANFDISVQGLRSYLQTTLPEYMVPTAYVVLDALPLTTNGKLDREALPAPDGASYVTREYEPPCGEVETAIARIWKDLLNLKRADCNGGSSMRKVNL